ncbi:MAG: PQQ-binding-like beta-propeller repeat protein [Candidatus Sumerlaeia bacterium]
MKIWKRSAILLAIFAVLISGTLSAQDWQCIQGNPQHTGRTDSVVTDATPFAKWEQSVGGSIFGSPVIVSNSLTNMKKKDIIAVSSGNDGYLRTYYPNGDLFWEQEMVGAMYGAPALGKNDEVYAADIDGNAYEFGLPDGAEVWSYDNTTSTAQERRFFANITPLPNGGMMVGDWMKKMRVLDDGADSYDADLNGYASSAVAISTDGTQAFYLDRPGGDRVKITCVNPSTGAEVWTQAHNPSTGGWSSMQVSGICYDEDNSRLYFVSQDIVSNNGAGSLLWSLDAANGDAMTSFPLDLEVGSYAIPALSPDGSSVYVTTLDGRLLAIDTSTASTSWEYDSGADAIRGSAVVDGEGKILFGDMSGVVHCVDSGGNEVWKYEEDDSVIASSLAITDSGDIIYGTMNGKLRRLTRAPIVIPYVNRQQTTDGEIGSGEYTGALSLQLNATTPNSNPGWNPMDSDVVTEADCSATVYLMHDNEYIYICFDVTDDDLSYDYQEASAEQHCNVWNDDCTEVFIDGDFDQDNTESTWGSVAGDQDWAEGQQPHFGIFGDTYWDNDSGYFGNYWWAKTVRGTNGYVTEYKFAFAGIDTADGETTTRAIQAGDVFGFNLLLNDDDDGGDREDQVSLFGGDHDNTLYKTQFDWHVAQLGEAPVAGPQIQVLDGTTELVHGVSEVDLGATTLNGPPLTHTFTVNNTGDAPLSISSVDISLPYTISEDLDATIPAGGSDTFSIMLPSDTAGDYLASISIISDSADQSIFTFGVTGEVSTFGYFTDTQIMEVVSDNSWEAGVWDFTLGEWQTQETGTGSASFGYELNYDTWFCVCLYDVDLGQWREAFYMYKQAWHQRTVNMPLSLSGKAQEIVENAAGPDDINKAPGDSVFADNLNINVYSDSNLRAMAWNYTDSQVVADDSQAAPMSLEVPALSGQWLCICIYDINSATWLDGIYVVRDRWF